MRIIQKGMAALRYLAIISTISIGVLLLVEFAVWLVMPDRYKDPPAVTADAWLFSDALAREDTAWMKEFVDEFCQSYNAHWTSYVYYRRNSFAGKHITVDTNGNRYTPAWDVRTIGNNPRARILLFGGSTMWGTGARDSGTIPSALSRLLASDKGVGPARVVNMGESGYVSTQAVIRLELELRRGNIPDLVILYDGVNDVFSAYQNSEAGLPQNETNRATEFNLLKDGKRMRRLGIEDLLNRTATASVLTSIRSALTAPPPPPSPHMEIAGDIVRAYRGNLEIVDALSKQFGFRYEAYWQPVVFSKKGPTAYEQSQSDKQQLVRPLFQDVYHRIEQDPVLRSHPHFHNISSIFDSIGKPVYLDFCHLSEGGNAIVAQRMYADTRPWLSSTEAR